MKSEHLEMVGAATQPVTLTGSAQTASVAIQPPTGPAAALPDAAAAATAPAAGKTYLHIDNVSSDKTNATYEVYVNLPPGADPASNQDHYAGTMHLFGVRQASRASDRHAGNGLGFSLDITGLIDKLKAKNAWDGRNVHVTFVQRRTGPAAAAAAPVREHRPIHVGRVSIYRA